MSNWSDVTPGGGSLPLGHCTTVQITCAGDSDVYLTLSLVFESGYELGHTSENSTRFPCGPTIPPPLIPKQGPWLARETKH